MYHLKIYFVLLISFLSIVTFKAMAQEAVIPEYHARQILVTPGEIEDGMSYLGFPALLRVGPDRMLISFKRGYSHGSDSEAILDMLHFDTKNNKILDQKTVAHDSGYVHQMGEWVQFPNGKIALYIDTQQTGHDSRHYRAGMREVQLKKEGNSFTPTETALSPHVDGREYGYPFNFIVDGNETYMLVMAFGYRPGGRWSVDVIKSEDNGKSWSFIRNLTEEFGGHHINESSFIPWEDGFFVTTRGYGPNQRIYRTDRGFRMLKENNLSEDYDFIEHHLGRPRLFKKDSRLYLIGRNWRTIPEVGRVMEMGLFRINPETLEITKYVILDNADRANMTDGHYPFPYFQERDGEIYLNVIDYRAVNEEHPKIVHHEFKWDEIR